MDYSAAARDVLDALRRVREADETIWWSRAALAIADLFPTSALAFALYQPAVWSRERRVQLRKNPPDGGAGFALEDLVAGAEAAANADDSRLVMEVHLGRAMVPYRSALLELGISVDPLIDQTAERAGPTLGAAVSKRPRIVGAARVPQLVSLLSDIDLEALLDVEERSGRIERKRSILNKEEHALVSHVDAAVALVN